MFRRIRMGAAVAFGLMAAVPAAAQDRALAFQVSGGTYSHLMNLNSAGTAHFQTGFNLGFNIGVFANKHLGFHGDFTWGNNQAKGDLAFKDRFINRYFYGAHVELQLPTGKGITPYLFGGGGGVTVNQDGGTVEVNRFTSAAGMFGGGLSYQIPEHRVEVFVEGKGLAYKWKSLDFNRTQLDMTLSMGLGYRVGF